jgi:hypothetical protein
VAVPRTKPSGDFTGRQAAALAKEAAEEKRQKAEQMAMITAQEQKEFEETVFDVTQQPDNPTIVDEVLELGVELAEDSIIVRVAEDVDNMTYGYGNTYHFKAGGKYKVPRGVADRLQELGLLYERL